MAECFIGIAPPPLYILPRRPIEAIEFWQNERHLFHSPMGDPHCIRIKTLDCKIGFGNSPHSPDIPFYDTDLEPEKYKDRDYYIYQGQRKEITVCFLRKDSRGHYYAYSKTGECELKDITRTSLR